MKRLRYGVLRALFQGHCISEMLAILWGFLSRMSLMMPLIRQLAKLSLLNSVNYMVEREARAKV